jgi:hypothetical protein
MCDVDQIVHGCVRSNKRKISEEPTVDTSRGANLYTFAQPGAPCVRNNGATPANNGIFVTISSNRSVRFDDHVGADISIRKNYRTRSDHSASLNMNIFTDHCHGMNLRLGAYKMREFFVVPVLHSRCKRGVKPIVRVAVDDNSDIPFPQTPAQFRARYHRNIAFSQQASESGGREVRERETVAVRQGGQGRKPSDLAVRTFERHLMLARKLAE